MTLQLFFRTYCLAMFSKYTSLSQGITKLNYKDTYFWLPRIVCKDGWSISLQINNSNYCESENGYRKLGHTWQNVEFGFPSAIDEKLNPYAETPNDTNTVGSIPVDVMEQICQDHGGIDWEATISVEVFEKALVN